MNKCQIIACDGKHCLGTTTGCHMIYFYQILQPMTGSYVTMSQVTWLLVFILMSNNIRSKLHKYTKTIPIYSERSILLTDVIKVKLHVNLPMLGTWKISTVYDRLFLVETSHFRISFNHICFILSSTETCTMIAQVSFPDVCWYIHKHNTDA